MAPSEKTPSRVVIVGAGMAGLGVAIALAGKDHRVTVLEAEENLNETGGGLQLSPNCTRVINGYGLTDDLANVSVRLGSINFRRYENGRIIGQTKLAGHMEEKFGHPYLLVARNEFQRVLFEGAVDLSVKVRFNSAVKHVDGDSSRPKLVLENGEPYAADLIIGADGVRSVCRYKIIEGARLDPIRTDSCAYRGTIKAEDVGSNDRTRHLLGSKDSNAWLGPHRQLLTYLIEGKDGPQFNIVGIHLGQLADPQKSKEEVRDLEGMRKAFADFDPTVQELLKMVDPDSAWRYQLQNLPQLETWRSKSGKVVLVGDAAHTMVPFLAQGAASAIEDGAALAECLERCASPEDIPNMTKDFEVMRKVRMTKLREHALYNEKLLHLPDGVEQEERDQHMQDTGSDACTNLWSHPHFSSWLFGYDAIMDTKHQLDSIHGL